MKSKEIKKQLNKDAAAIEVPDVLENIKNADFNNYKGLPENGTVNVKPQRTKPLKLTRKKFGLISAIAAGMAAVLVLSIGLPIWLSNNNPTPTANLAYRLMPTENAYEVSIGTATDKDIVIASKHNGRPVKQIAKDGFTNTDIESIVMPDSITVIVDGDGALERGAFSDCNNLKSVVLSKNITSIGIFAFAHCESLANITVSNSVKNIGDLAFTGCSNLESVIFETNSQLTDIGTQVFFGCSSLKSITIPASVTSIGTNLFSYCDGLESIIVETGNMVYKSEGNCLIQIANEWNKSVLIAGCKNSIIPNDVTSIYPFAFLGCNSLTNIIISNSVTSIGNYAFYGCSGLTSIIIPESVTIISNYVFENCLNLTIYVETASKPDGWYETWNHSNCPVIWGYTGD